MNKPSHRGIVSSQEYTAVQLAEDSPVRKIVPAWRWIGGLFVGTAALLVPTVQAQTATLTTLHVFSGGSDGGSPSAAVVHGSDGNFYGTTQSGGSCGCIPYGTVYKITASGAITTLHTFNGNDGAQPAAGLVQGSDGNFYGTTSGGGIGGVSPEGGDDFGTVYKIGSSAKSVGDI